MNWTEAKKKGFTGSSSVGTIYGCAPSPTTLDDEKPLDGVKDGEVTRGLELVLAGPADFPAVAT